MGIHRRYYGQSAEPQEKAKPDSADTDTAAHLMDALNKDAANALRNERLRESDKKQSTR
jgi:hypothetical protein